MGVNLEIVSRRLATHRSASSPPRESRRRDIPSESELHEREGIVVAKKMCIDQSADMIQNLDVIASLVSSVNPRPNIPKSKEAAGPAAIQTADLFSNSCSVEGTPRADPQSPDPSRRQVRR